MLELHNQYITYFYLVRERSAMDFEAHKLTDSQAVGHSASQSASNPTRRVSLFFHNLWDWRIDFQTPLPPACLGYWIFVFRSWVDPIHSNSFARAQVLYANLRFCRICNKRTAEMPSAAYFTLKYRYFLVKKYIHLESTLRLLRIRASILRLPGWMTIPPSSSPMISACMGPTTPSAPFLSSCPDTCSTWPNSSQFKSHTEIYVVQKRQ